MRLDCDRDARRWTRRVDSEGDVRSGGQRTTLGGPDPGGFGDLVGLRIGAGSNRGRDGSAGPDAQTDIASDNPTLTVVDSGDDSDVSREDASAGRWDRAA